MMGDFDLIRISLFILALAGCNFQMNENTCKLIGDETLINKFYPILSEKVSSEYGLPPRQAMETFTSLYEVQYFDCGSRFFIQGLPKSFPDPMVVLTGGPQNFYVNRGMNRIFGPLGRDA